MSQPAQPADLHDIVSRLAIVERRLDDFDRRMDEFDELTNLVRDIHRTLFDPPRPNAPAMVDRVIQLVETAEKSRYAYNMAIKLVLTAGAVVGALAAIITFLGDKA